MELDASNPGSPPAATVSGNRWMDIRVPELGTWEPTRRVTVVIPYFERQVELERTLAALTVQTYPQDLIEVVVVDDGSASPPDIPEFAEVLDVSVQVQDDRGYGLARARNLGARVATGEILIYLDCDMIAEPLHVEAHARWHHTVSNAVVSGFRWHADFSASNPSEVADAVAVDDVLRLVAGQTPLRPERIEKYLERTEMLMRPADDAFLVTSGGNLSIRRDFYLTIGGNDESFTQWGGEDNEFGFRVIQAGAVIVPERHAVCWHQGEGHMPSPEEVRSHLLQTPKMQNLIAELGYRKPQAGCTYTVPYGVVAVDGRQAPASTTVRAVESILGSQFHDLAVVVTAPTDTYESEWIVRRFASDHRVQVRIGLADVNESHRFSPLQIYVPSGVLFHEATMDKIVDLVRAGGVGILYATLHENDRSVGTLRAVSTRAINRARLSAAAPDEVELLIAEMFGERRVSGHSLGLEVVDDSGDVRPSDRPVESGPGQGPADGAADLKAMQGRIDELTRRSEELATNAASLESRRSLRIANAAGSLRSIRSRQDASLAVAALWNAFRGINT